MNLKHNSIVFVKVAKTGSTTVKKILLSMKNGKELKGERHKLPKLCQKVFKANLWLHHIKFSKQMKRRFKKVMIGKVHFVASIRDPLKRLESHYYFSHPRKHSMTFSEWYLLPNNNGNEDPSGKWIHKSESNPNFQMRFMGWDSVPSVEEIKKRYFHVFILENLQQSVDDFSKKVNMPLTSICHARKNKIIKDTITQEAKDKFQILNKDDILFYNNCKKAFNLI